MTAFSKHLYPLIVLVSLLVVHLAVHTPLLITDYFGEPDAARLVNDSIKASYNGGFNELEYNVHSSPLYSSILCSLVKRLLFCHMKRWPL